MASLTNDLEQLQKWQDKLSAARSAVATAVGTLNGATATFNDISADYATKIAGINADITTGKNSGDAGKVAAANTIDGLLKDLVTSFTAAQNAVAAMVTASAPAMPGV